MGEIPLSDNQRPPVLYNLAMFEQIEPAKLKLSPTRAAISILVLVFALGMNVGVLIGRGKWDLADWALTGFLTFVCVMTGYRLLASFKSAEKQHGH